MYPSLLHLDGDAFFASCEVSRNPRLKGKPVVVGRERGIAAAFSYEAKALGIFRGMPIGMVKRVCPQAIILPGDYELYATISHHLFSIMRRHLPVVETYGIDEGFGQFLDTTIDHTKEARTLKDDIEASLGLTISLGLAETKVLAKVASKIKKPSGFTVITHEDIVSFLANVSVEKIWGVGRQTVIKLYQLGVKTALDLYTIPEHIIQAHFSRPLVELWHELHGEGRWPLDPDPKADKVSLSRTRTFRPTSDKNLVFSELIHNIEGAAQKAREQGTEAYTVSIFIKEQTFRYHNAHTQLPQPSAYPEELIRAIKPLFETLYRPNTVYRATGVTLSQFSPTTLSQTSFFDSYTNKQKKKDMWHAVDTITETQGEGSIQLGSNLFRRKQGKAGVLIKKTHFSTLGGIPIGQLVV